MTNQKLTYSSQYLVVYRCAMVILMLMLISRADAATYYFSSANGNDLNSSTQAKSAVTPWKSIDKLNSFFSNLQAGDTVLFMRGNVFYGTIQVARSGSSGRPIVFDAYGTGADPVISGLSTLSGWTNTGDGIWESAPCTTCGSKLNILLINNVSVPMGRYPNADAPNKGFLTYESHVGNTSIIDNELPASPNWTGAELVVRKERWVTDRSLILNHSGNTISYFSQTNYSAMDGFGYFIQNDKRTLDKKNEWYYNPSTKRIYLFFGDRTPPANVQVSSANNFVNINSKSNIEFHHLAFNGSNLSGFELINAQNITVRNCSISNAGIDAVYGLSLTGFTIDNCTVTNSNNNAIYLSGGPRSTSITNNIIRNTGVNIGMGDATHYNLFCGIAIGGSAPNHSVNTLIQNNEIDSTGYNAITFSGSDVTIKNNLIDAFCFTQDDGGGIYTYRASTDAFHYTNRQIVGNIVLNGKTASEGTSMLGKTSTNGIYMDDNSEALTISGNTVAHIPGSGIFLHNAGGADIRNNILFDNKEQLRFGHDNTGTPIRNVTNFGNILFAKNPDQLCFSYSTTGRDIDSFGTADNNYYCRPLNEDNSIYTSDANEFDTYDVARWKSRSQKDKHSKKTATPLTEYNIDKITGSNKSNNGKFDSNTDGSYCYNATETCLVGWDGSGKLDGGSMKVSYSRNKVGTTYVIMNIGEISSNKDYILRFSVLGTKPGGSIGAFLRQSGEPYHNLTPVVFNLLSNTRLDEEVLFSSPVKESKASIVFQVNNVDSSFWLDNIELYKADVTINNPDDSIRFEYNATKLNKQIQLDDKYIGVDSAKYSNSVVLAPYTSLILIRDNRGKKRNGPSKLLITKTALIEKRLYRNE